MLRPSQDAHDDHLRLLLDQRTTRADVHGRFSALSQFTDTPSVYSRAVFSPKLSDKQESEGDYSYLSSSPYPAEAYPNRDHPTVSMLDLDDDPRSSCASFDNHDHDYSHSFDNEDDNEPLPRMSYLGPKMRFHSRAPWELDETTLEEEEEVEESPRHFASGFPFSRGNGSRSATSDSPSPRPSNGSRPSEESSRSQGSRKASIETTSSQISYPRGALYALAQESLSTSSLGRSSTSGQKEGFRGKFSIGRVRSRSPAAGAIPSPRLSPTCTPVHPSFPPQTFLQNGHHDETCLPAECDSYKVRYPARPLSSSSSEDDRHPYANPDLVISYAMEPLPKSPLRSAMQFPPRNDSNLTVTDSFTTLTLSNSGTRSTLSIDSYSSSSSSRNRLSSLQGRDISSPVSAHSISKDEKVLPVPPPDVVNLPGWTDRATGPAFSLISLEEARAQRMRGSSNHDAAPRSSNASAVSSSTTPFPSNEHEIANIADVTSSGGTVSRTRGRTISAGAKAKNALQTIVGQKPDRRESEPAIFGNQPPLGAQPNKTLKHKKSGFMRLFNSGKTNEKDEPEAPPVPSLSDAYAAHNQQHSRGAQKATLHRIPVPSISPSMFEASPVHDTISPSGDSSTSVRATLNPRRTPKSLHIDTFSQGLVPRGAASARGGDEFHQTRTLPASSETPWRIESQPQSAPANASQFPSLKLRPVSALFSTHFGDHIVSDPETIYETDLDTPRSSSPTGLVSPVTPASYSRSSNEQLYKSSISGDSSSLVHALQEQVTPAWQQHIWELEGQVRDLKAEVEELKAFGKDNAFCSTCGRGEKRSPDGPKRDIGSAPGAASVVNRPRARTGTSSRFGNAMP